MSFTQAISDGFSKYAKFDGRSSRSAYWWWFLFALIVFVIAYAVSVAINSFVLYFIVALALLLPNLGVAVRRLHDTGRSGWWLLIGFIPFGGFVLLFFDVQPSDGPNKYGQGPDGGAAVAGSFTGTDAGPTFQKG